MEEKPNIKLLTIQPLNDCILIEFDMNTHSVCHYSFPCFVAIYGGQESPKSPFSYYSVYLSTSSDTSTCVEIGFNQQDPSLPFVRNKFLKPLHQEHLLKGIDSYWFDLLFEHYQSKCNDGDYIPDYVNEKNRAKNVKRDFEALKEELILNGVKVSSSISEILKTKLSEAEDILANIDSM